MNLRKLEYASAALLVLGICLWLARINAVTTLLLLAGGTLVLINLVSAFWGYGNTKPSEEELASRSSAERLLTYALGYSSAVIVLALVFMLCMFPQPRMLTTVGLFTIVPVAGIIAYQYFAKGEEAFSKMLIRAAIYAMVAAIVFSVKPINVAEYKYGHNPHFAAYKQTVMASEANPSKELRKQAHDMLQEIIRQEREHK